MASLACWVGLAGCSMCRMGVQNLCTAPKQFPSERDRRATQKFHQQVAQDAIQEMLSDDESVLLNPDYLAGFEEGVVDYLTYGGDRRPPLLPPRRYWNLSLRGIECQQPGQMWLMGCEDGRAYAERSGYRHSATVVSDALSGRDWEGETLSSDSVEMSAGDGEVVSPLPDLDPHRDSDRVDESQHAVPDLEESEALVDEDSGMTTE
ncbi:MAG: hypothetical protein U0929_09565 [Planctomycetaceae bacterium]